MCTVVLVFHLIKTKTVKVRILDYLVRYNFKAFTHRKQIEYVHFETFLITIIIIIAHH